MAKYPTLKALLTAIANSLRGKTGDSGKIVADDFPSVIDSLSTGGITPTGTKSITANGEHDVTSFAKANVNVPVGVTPSGTKSITANGTHDVTNYASANVNVPVPSGYIKPSGTQTITTNGEHDVTSFAKANVNVPIPSGYVKPSGTKSITANGTHDVTNYASASVNVPVGITPSGTKNITTNGTHDVTNYASAQVNVPTGITPSGSINITANGTHNVTNYASAVVNVPTPAQITEVRTITIDSDLGNGTNANRAILSADSFVAEHYADEGFSATLIPVTPAAGATNVTHFVYHGNRNIGSSNTVRYGYAVYNTSATGFGIMQATAKLNGKGYNVCLRADNTGKLNLYVDASRIVKAGTYQIILTCTT